MRVLFLITNADLSGAPIHLLDLAKGIKEKHEILVVFGVNGPIIKDFNAADLNTKVLHTMKSDFNVLNDIRSIKSFIKIIREFNPDIIHSHSSKAGLIGRISSYLMNVKSVFTVHGWGFGENQGKVKSFVLIAMEKFLKRLTSYYIFVSEFDFEVAKQKFGRVKGSVIYNGSNFKIYNQLGRIELDMIMVARNDPQKDYETLIKALKVSKFNSIKFVGKGTDSQEFKNHVQSLVGDNYSKIEFLGERRDIDVLLENSNLFVLSTNYEGLPISIIEAMSKSLPIIATNVGGISELVSDECNGFLVEHRNPNQLSEKINILSEDVFLRNKFGDISKEIYLEKFQSQKMVECTLSVYELIKST